MYLLKRIQKEQDIVLTVRRIDILYNNVFLKILQREDITYVLLKDTLYLNIQILKILWMNIRKRRNRNRNRNKSRIMILTQLVHILYLPFILLLKLRIIHIYQSPRIKRRKRKAKEADLWILN